MKRLVALFAICLMVACQQQGWQPPNMQRLALVKDSVGYKMWLDTASIDSAGKLEHIPFFPLRQHEFIKYTVYIARRDSVAHRDPVPIDSSPGPWTQKPIDGAVEHELAHCSSLEYYSDWRAKLFHGQLVDSASYDRPLDFYSSGGGGDHGYGVCERCNPGMFGGTMVQTACAYAAHKHLVTVSK